MLLIILCFFIISIIGNVDSFIMIEGEGYLSCNKTEILFDLITFCEVQKEACDRAKKDAENIVKEENTYNFIGKNSNSKNDTVVYTTGGILYKADCKMSEKMILREYISRDTCYK